MKKYKIGIVGRFGFGMNAFGGQSIKTRNLYEALCDKIGDDNIFCVDTRGWERHPFKLLCNIRKATSQCESVIILPAGRGVKVIPKLTLLCNQDAKLFYSVIGGWLPKMTETNKRLRKTLKKYDGIWVEAFAMKKTMEEQGFSNISVVPNFKNITPLKPNELVYHITEPYKLCTFSRVLKEKGIEDAVNAVKAVNDRCGKTVFTLDIYGQVDKGYTDRFNVLVAEFPNYIRYMGKAPSDRSVDILKFYFMLLFPSYYYGEGFPGTLIDALSAGIPVIASDWAYNTEIIRDGYTGLITVPQNVDDLSKKLEYCYHHVADINHMKYNCIIEAQKYSKDIIAEQITKLINK